MSDPKATPPVPIFSNPLPKPVKFDFNNFNGVNPINRRNGIAGSATIKAGPANAVLNIPFKTLVFAISLNPPARSFIALLKPPPVLTLDALSTSFVFSARSPALSAPPAATLSIFSTPLSAALSAKSPPFSSNFSVAFSFSLSVTACLALSAAPAAPGIPNADAAFSTAYFAIIKPI